MCFLKSLFKRSKSHAAAGAAGAPPPLIPAQQPLAAAAAEQGTKTYKSQACQTEHRAGGGGAGERVGLEDAVFIGPRVSVRSSESYESYRVPATPVNSVGEVG